MKYFRQAYGPWALITGASSGLGHEFARQLAAKGLNLVLAARRKDLLCKHAAKLSQTHGIETRVIPVDLAESDFMGAIQAGVETLEIGLLINNAGFAVTGRFVDNSKRRELDMLHLNCRAAALLAHQLGRRMSVRGRGGIVFVSSIAAFGAMPLWSHI